MNKKIENKITYDEMVDILNCYTELKRQELQLQYEIDNFEKLNEKNLITEQDIIDSMSFGGSSGERTTGGQMSDKTSKIALSYKDVFSKIDLKNKIELETDLAYLKSQINRIDYYVSILPERSSKAIRMLYLEGFTYMDAAKELGVVVDTLKNLRKKGILELAEMFSRIAR